MARAGRLREGYAGYVAAGANVAVIGMGEPARAARYAHEQSIRCPVLADPNRTIYRAYGLLQGDTPHILFDAPDEFLRREPAAGAGLQESRLGTPRALVDDPWQLPGDFVVAPGGVLRLTYRAQYCEDYLDPRVTIAAIRLASGEL